MQLAIVCDHMNNLIPLLGLLLWCILWGPDVEWGAFRPN